MHATNVVRLPKRRRARVQADRPGAQVLQFPDKIGLTAPAFNPGNPDHRQVWQSFYEAGTLWKAAAKAPQGHPLSRWYLAELRRLHPDCGLRA